MIRKYELNIDENTQEELDDILFQAGIEIYVWWEEQNRFLATDNMKVVADLEKILTDLGIEIKVVES